MAHSSKGHVTILTYFAWGHLRPESALAVTIARKFNEATITLFVHIDSVARASNEVLRQCSSSERSSIVSRVRIIGLGKPFSGPGLSISDMHMEMLSPGNMMDRFPDVFAKIERDEELVDDNGVSWAPVGCKPGVIITDTVMGPSISGISGKSDIPLLIYWFGSAAAFTRIFAPVALGGRQDYTEEVQAAFDDPVIRNGRTFDEVARDLHIRTPRFPDDIVRVKGLPPAYQWENFPQPLWLPPTFHLLSSSYQLVKGVQGVIIPSTVELEPDGFKGVEEFFLEGGKRQVLAVGPQLPREYITMADRAREVLPSFASSEVNTGTAPTEQVKPNDVCLSFLDAAFAAHGALSVLYIAFGTLFFPLVPRHVEILLESLLMLESPMPFIFSTSTAASYASIPTSLLEKVKSSGRGLVVQWAPQQAILTHPAVGWILAHGGGNSMFEALSQGLPSILWPFYIDQPAHSLWLSEGIDAAYELLQIRIGPGAQKAYRGGPNGTVITGTDEAIRAEMVDVFRKCKGEDGRRKRRNAQKARELILEGVKPGGTADAHLGRLSIYMK